MNGKTVFVLKYVFPKRMQKIVLKEQQHVLMGAEEQGYAV